MNELPPGWVETTLGEIADVVSGSTPRTTVPEYWGGDIAWITPDDLSGYRSKYIERGARNITQAGYGHVRRRSCRPAPFSFRRVLRSGTWL
jgi:type I restriction enzyme S subunit